MRSILWQQPSSRFQASGCDGKTKLKIILRGRAKILPACHCQRRLLLLHGNQLVFILVQHMAARGHAALGWAWPREIWKETGARRDHAMGYCVAGATIDSLSSVFTVFTLHHRLDDRIAQGGNLSLLSVPHSETWRLWGRQQAHPACANGGLPLRGEGQAGLQLHSAALPDERLAYLKGATQLAAGRSPFRDRRMLLTRDQRTPLLRGCIFHTISERRNSMH